MKRVVSICLLLGLAMVFLVPQDLFGQTVAIKRVAISPRLRTGPAGTWQISSGLRTVGKGTKVFLNADTTGAITSFAWSIVTAPGGSTAAIDTPSNQFVRFTPDVTGRYVVRVTANGSVDAFDTLFASTYVGVSTLPPSCGGNAFCHAEQKAKWEQTPHATIFMRGISGQLEEEGGHGFYSKACVKCHTTGNDPTVNNGNFGYLAAVTGFDTSWYHAYPDIGGEFAIPYNDSTAINMLRSQYSQLQPTANIGCESCHGPGADHIADPSKISASYDAGVCQQCHDAPAKHRLGSYWAASSHSTWAEGGHTGQNGCYPCHSGSAFAKWAENGKTGTSFYTASDAGKNLSCSGCHDPHGNNNPQGLRTMVLDSLRNGYVPPAGMGGKGLLCANCHNSRYSVAAKITTTPPYYGWSDRFYPHYNMQADVFFGSNGYQYGDNNLTGQMTHAGVENSCVTCHMAERVNGSSMHSNHEMNMKDSLGNDVATACRDCHGSHVESFDDIQAFSDYDQDGVIEGVQAEVHGLLDRLKAILPIDSATGEPVTMRKDSLKVKNRPDLIQGIWNYYFVKYDGSYGIHNTKYTVALLQKALGIYPLDVKQSDSQIPSEFALNQNYPNPFNPSTRISFSIPAQSTVRLEVYDLLGKLVSTIVDKDLAAGNYDVTWDATDSYGAKVASGLYLYKLQAGQFSSVKKMVLVK